MATAISSSAAPAPLYFEIPLDVLGVIFQDRVITYTDIVAFSSVCKAWRAAAHNPKVTERFINLLQKLYLIPQKLNEDQDRWSLLTHNYYARCEVFVDVSQSMCNILETERETKLSLGSRLIQKTEEVISSLLQLGSKVILSPFSDKVETSLSFPGKLSVPEAMEKLNSYIDMSTVPLFLVNKLENHKKERKEYWSKKKLMIVISDLNFHSDVEAKLLDRIKKINDCVSIRKNLALSFMELIVSDYSNGFKAGLVHFLRKHPSITYVKVINELDEECHSPPLKRRKITKE